jgi:hypothetical protein
VFKAGLNNITKPYLLIFSKTKQNKTKQNKRGGYSGSRDQEDCGSMPALANSSRDPISKKRLVEWLKM